MPADKKLQETLIEYFGKRYLDRVELPQYLYTSLSRKLRPYQDECFRGNTLSPIGISVFHHKTSIIFRFGSFPQAGNHSFAQYFT